MRCLRWIHGCSRLTPLLCILFLTAAYPSDPLFEIHLRDGSVLHAYVPDEPLLLSGQDGDTKIRPSETEEILFAERHEPDLIETAERLIRGLADHEYRIRERSARDLEAMGGLVLPELQEALGSHDPEVKFRARAILRQLEARGVEEISKLDRIRTPEGTLHGLLRLPSIRAKVEGREVQIRRDELTRIVRHRRRAPPASLYVRGGDRPVETGLTVRKGDRLDLQVYGHTFLTEAGIPGLPPGHPSSSGLFLARVGESPSEFKIGGREPVYAPTSGPLYLRVGGSGIEGWVLCKVQAVRDSDLPPAHRRLARDAFGARSAKVDFDRAPDGSPVRPGDNVETLYAPLGVILETEVADSYVAADAYTVNSSSRGNSAANREPRWTGDITIRFIVPGSFRRTEGRGEAAGVRRFGVHVAAVRPQGTGLEAFDRQGRSIGRIFTRSSGTAFLGIATRVPIFMIRIFDVASIDPNFAIDDLYFDTPRRLPPPRFTVKLRDGQRLACSSLALDDGVLDLRSDRLGRTIRLAETRIDSISFPSEATFSSADRPRWATITTTTGDRISGTLDSWEDGQVAILPWGGDRVRLPVAMIRTMELRREGQESPPPESGEGGAVRVIRIDGKVAVGSALRLSERRRRPVLLCLREDGDPETIPLSEVDRVVLSSPAPREARLPRIAVLTNSGDLMRGSPLGIDDRRLHLRTPWADRVSLYRSSIDRVEFFAAVDPDPRRAAAHLPGNEEEPR